MIEALERLKRDIAVMRRDVEGNRSKPHKFVLLLAVIELAERGILTENRIVYDQRLRDTFAKYFEVVAQEGDLCQPVMPFFHLRESPFWCHKMRDGFELQAGAVDARTGKPARRIKNIEYAYFDNQTFNLICDIESRRNLRDFIIALFPPPQSERLKAMLQPSEAKLGTAFHETFPLDRSRLASILDTFVTHGGDGSKLTYDDFKGRSGLGANQVKSFRRYAYGTGLVDGAGRLTPFGAAVSQHDPQLSKAATQWTMHYHLVAPHHNGPLFWNHLATTAFVNSHEMTREGTGQLIKSFLTANGERALADDTYTKTATVFLGSYERGGGLESLEILSADNNKYLVGRPRPITPGAFACVLADYWAARWGNGREALLSDLAGGELASLLLLSSGEVNSLLRELSRLHLLDLQRRTPPFQVIRRWDDPALLWRERLFADSTR